MNRKIIDIAIILMILFVLGIGIFMVVYLKSNASECLKNPIEYMHSKNENIICSCFDKSMFSNTEKIINNKELG